MHYLPQGKSIVRGASNSESSGWQPYLQVSLRFLQLAIWPRCGSNREIGPLNLACSQKSLYEVIPELAKRLIESHPHVGQSEPGPAPGYFRNSEFRVKSRTLEDGSIIQPTDDARKSVAKILRKSGCSEAPIQKALAEIDEAPENKRVKIAPGLEVVKWTVQDIEPDFSRAQLMNPLVPAKIAFEFLAAHLGTAIYDDVPQLSEVRQVLMKSIPETDVIQVERLSSNKYEPFHGICFEGNNPHAKVQVRLFGYLVFRVHFFHLSVGGARFAYTHKLDTAEESVDAIDGQNHL